MVTCSETHAYPSHSPIRDACLPTSFIPTATAFSLVSRPREPTRPARTTCSATFRAAVDLSLPQDTCPRLFFHFTSLLVFHRQSRCPRPTANQTCPFASASIPTSSPHRPATLKLLPMYSLPRPPPPIFRSAFRTPRTLGAAALSAPPPLPLPHLVAFSTSLRACPSSPPLQPLRRAPYSFRAASALSPLQRRGAAFTAGRRLVLPVPSHLPKRKMAHLRCSRGRDEEREAAGGRDERRYNAAPVGAARAAMDGPNSELASRATAKK